MNTLWDNFLYNVQGWYNFPFFINYIKGDVNYLAREVLGGRMKQSYALDLVKSNSIKTHLLTRFFEDKFQITEDDDSEDMAWGEDDLEREVENGDEISPKEIQILAHLATLSEISPPQFIEKMFETDCLGRLVMDKKQLETQCCAFCQDSKHLKIIDYYLPKDTKICEEKKCKYYQDNALSELFINLGLFRMEELPEKR